MDNALTAHYGDSAEGFHDFSAFSAYLDTLGLFRMKPGLERMHAVLSRLGLQRPACTVVQVAGTNGKGSTSTMLESLARCHGLSTGLHTSPHFVTVRERIRVNGRMLDEDRWTLLANHLIQNGGRDLSYFEFVTAMAVLAFAQAKVDIAIMETGLGGTYDATGAVEADMVVFTPIGLDHQAILGPTLKDIAADKAGCIRYGKPVISAEQAPEAMAEILQVARQRHAEVYPANDPAGLPEPLAARSRGMRLQGEHQRANALVALAAWRRLLEQGLVRAAVAASAGSGVCADRGREAGAIASAWLPGRLQRIPPMPKKEGADGFPGSHGWPAILLDGAHNPHGLAALGLSLAQEGIAPSAVIFACVADKDVEQMLPHLRVLATGPIFVPPIKDNPRAVPPEDLAALIGLNATACGSLQEALERACAHLAGRVPEVFSQAATKNPLLICGSLYLLGEFFSLRPDCLEAGYDDSALRPPETRSRRQ